MVVPPSNENVRGITHDGHFFPSCLPERLRPSDLARVALHPALTILVVSSGYIYGYRLEIFVTSDEGVPCCKKAGLGA